jgi:hypothetical protein
MYRNLDLSCFLFNISKCFRNIQPIIIAHPLVAIQIAYDLRYVGPHFEGHTYLLTHQSHVLYCPNFCTYDPATFPNCESALINASDTARLDAGRAIVLLTHANSTMNPAYDCAIRNLMYHAQCCIRM